jgi:hypothetical protein
MAKPLNISVKKAPWVAKQEKIKNVFPGPRGELLLITNASIYQALPMGDWRLIGPLPDIDDSKIHAGMGRDMILLYYRDLGLVQGYSMRGTLLWTEAWPEDHRCFMVDGEDIFSCGQHEYLFAHGRFSPKGIERIRFFPETIVVDGNRIISFDLVFPSEDSIILVDKGYLQTVVSLSKSFLAGGPAGARLLDRTERDTVYPNCHVLVIKGQVFLLNDLDDPALSFVPGPNPIRPLPVPARLAQFGLLERFRRGTPRDLDEVALVIAHLSALAASDRSSSFDDQETLISIRPDTTGVTAYTSHRTHHYPPGARWLSSLKEVDRREIRSADDYAGAMAMFTLLQKGDAGLAAAMKFLVRAPSSVQRMICGYLLARGPGAVDRMLSLINPTLLSLPPQVRDEANISALIGAFPDRLPRHAPRALRERALPIQARWAWLEGLGQSGGWRRGTNGIVLCSTSHRRPPLPTGLVHQLRKELKGPAPVQAAMALDRLGLPDRLNALRRNFDKEDSYDASSALMTLISHETDPERLSRLFEERFPPNGPAPRIRMPDLDDHLPGNMRELAAGILSGHLFGRDPAAYFGDFIESQLQWHLSAFLKITQEKQLPLILRFLRAALVALREDQDDPLGRALGEETMQRVVRDTVSFGFHLPIADAIALGALILTGMPTMADFVQGDKLSRILGILLGRRVAGQASPFSGPSAQWTQRHFELVQPMVEYLNIHRPEEAFRIQAMFAFRGLPVHVMGLVSTKGPRTHADRLQAFGTQTDGATLPSPEALEDRVRAGMRHGDLLDRFTWAQIWAYRGLEAWEEEMPDLLRRLHPRSPWTTGLALSVLSPEDRQEAVRKHLRAPWLTDAHLSLWLKGWDALSSIGFIRDAAKARHWEPSMVLGLLEAKFHSARPEVSQNAMEAYMDLWSASQPDDESGLMGAMYCVEEGRLGHSPDKALDLLERTIKRLTDSDRMDASQAEAYRKRVARARRRLKSGRIEPPEESGIGALSLPEKDPSGRPSQS